MGMAFADDPGDPSKRKAARVPWKPSKSEFVDEDGGEGAESSGRFES